MSSSNTYKPVTTFKYLLVSAALCSPILANSRTIQNAANSGANPFAVQQTSRLPARTQSHRQPNRVLTIGSEVSVIDTYICAELNAVAIATGHEPVNLCNENSTNYQGAPATPAANPDPNPDPSESPDEDVLLIHGFSSSSGHDCDFYWQAQKETLKQINREAIILGWYKDNTNGCVTIPGTGQFDNNIPTADIAELLRDYIVENYTSNHKSVDIVAHSMGGIVVRKMLDDWGQDVWVSDVVTLGTPHDGAKAEFVDILCPHWDQCVELQQGNSFMNSLEPNPQSIIPTQWTLIGAANDQVVGYGTATDMSIGTDGGPTVNAFEYQRNHKHGCSWLVPPLGHASLHGDNASRTVYVCNNWGQIVSTIDTPTDRIISAIN